MLVWLMATLATAACDLPTLHTDIANAEKAFADMEAVGFSGSENNATRTLECLSQPLTPIEVASYHRLEALRSFFDDDHPSTILNFQAMLATQPGYALPDTIAPEGHPLRDDFVAAQQFAVNDTFALKPPAQGWINIDGKRAEAAPSGRPFVFQLFADDGTVVRTAYVPVGSPLPTYAVKPTTSLVDPDPNGGKTGGGGGGKGALIGTGVGVAAVGLGLYGGAFVTRGNYDDAVTAGDEAKINSSYKTTNLLTITSLGLVGAGGVLVIAGAF